MLIDFLFYQKFLPPHLLFRQSVSGDGIYVVHGEAALCLRLPLLRMAGGMFKNSGRSRYGLNLAESYSIYFQCETWNLRCGVRFKEYGVDGGHVATVFRPRNELLTAHMISHLGMMVPEIEIKFILAAVIALKGIGGILFILGRSLGAYLLLLYLVISTPIMYDFYNYDLGTPEFHQLLVKFAQEMAFSGALLFFLGMRSSISRRKSKRRAPKSKTA